MSRLIRSALTIVMLVGCGNESIQLTVRPPLGTTRMELVIVQGPCPITSVIASGRFRCLPSVLHTDVLEEGEVATLVPPIEGPHAIIAVASVEGCGLQVACVAQGGPADANILNFTNAGSDCGGLRACSSAGMCEFTSCETIPSELDADGDGISNGFECCGQACVAETEVFVNECVNTDGSDEPDYLDENSDGDAYLDSDECFGNEDEVGYCDHDGNSVPDFQDTEAPNLAGDFDGDGIADTLECGITPGRDACVDTDCDGYPDSHDLDSDDDGLSDSEECSCVEAECGTCPDTDGDQIADFRDPLENGCTCSTTRGAEPTGSCRFDTHGSYCAQQDFGSVSELGMELRWLSAADDEPLAPETDFELGDLGDLSIPAAARRFPSGMMGCALGGTSAAIGELSAGMMVRGYIVDLRGPEAEGLLPDSPTLTTRLGRFIYNPMGVVVGSL